MEYIGYSTTTSTSTQYFFETDIIAMLWYNWFSTVILLGIIIFAIFFLCLIQYLKKY